MRKEGRVYALVILGAAGACLPLEAAAAAPPEAQTRILERWALRPFAFEANRGQAAPDASFVAHTGGLTLEIGAGEVVIAPNRDPAKALRIRLAHVHPNVTVEGEGELSGRVNYFLGSDPGKWPTDIRAFERVRLHEAWKGVDVVFYGNGDRLEYDLVVRPKADLKAIGLSFEGDQPRVNAEGDLVFDGALSGFVQTKPLAYQETDAGREILACRYVLDGKSRVRLAVEGRDPSRPLVIDPTLVYSKTLAGTESGALNVAYAVAADSAGNAYVTGMTGSQSFPTAGALQGSSGGAIDVFVTKLDPTGNVVYSTYLGGNGRDEGHGIAVDAAGNVYLAGVTSSTNFPTKGPIQAALSGGAGNDAFVAKINAAGNALVFSTYLGGGKTDRAMGIAVDSSGAAYVTGYTASSNFPTRNALQPALGKSTATNAFVTKLSPDGTSLVWSTYLGGTFYENTAELEDAGAIAVDGSGAVYVTGYTMSDDFPTKNPFVAKRPGGYYVPSVFITKIAADGSGLVFSSFLPGGSYDYGFGIAVDSAGSAYIGGRTQSYAGLGTPGSFQPNAAHSTGGQDAFVAKLKPDGSGLAWATYLGGTGSTGAYGIALDPSGNVNVAGYTASPDFPTLNPIQAHGGGVLFKSTNAGGAWTVSNQGLKCAGVSQLVQDSSNPAVLYAATDNDLFKSTDGGTTWAPTGFSFFGVSGVAIDPSSPSTVYASSAIGGFQKSTDGGKTWAPASAFPAGTGRPVFDPSSPGTIYARSGTGIFKTTDGGVTWKQLGGGLPAKSFTIFVIDPRSPSTLYAGGGDASSALLYKSTDGGTTWASSASGLPLPVNSLVIDPASSSTLYAAQGATGFGAKGVFKTTNGGSSWTLVQETQWAPTTLAITPSAPAMLYLSGIGGSVDTPGQGIWASTDGGNNFTQLGLNGHLANAIVVDKSNPSSLIVGASGGRSQFLATLKPDGSALTGSTYFGGTSTSTARAIAAAGANAVRLVGSSSSADFAPQHAGARAPLSTATTQDDTYAAALAALTGQPPKTDVSISMSFDPPSFLTMGYSRTLNVRVTNNGPNDVQGVLFSLDAEFPGPTPAQAQKYGVNWSSSYKFGGCSGPGLVPGSDHVFEQSCHTETGPIPSGGAVTLPYYISWIPPLASPMPFTFEAQITGILGADDTDPTNNSATASVAPTNPGPKVTLHPCSFAGGLVGPEWTTDAAETAYCSFGDIAPDITTITGPNGFRAGVPPFQDGYRFHRVVLKFPPCYFSSAGPYVFTVTNSPPGGGAVTFGFTVAPYPYLPPTPGVQQDKRFDYLTLDGNYGPPPTSPCASTRVALAAGAPTVSFNGVAAPVPAWTNTVILTQVPAGATSGPITVTSPAGTVTSTQSFTVLPTSTPAVSSASPSSGPAAGGTSVTITGSGFQPGATVAFGGVPAKGISVTSATSLTALAPPGSGTVDVKVMNQDTGTATKTAAFTYSAGSGTTTRFVPVALDVVSNVGQTTAHFLTELTLTNSGTSDASISMTYMPSIGGGGGVAGDALPKGTQKVIADAIAYLRSKGLAIPTSGAQLGTISIQFSGVSSVDAVSATARTASATSAPQPIGFAGLAYSGLYSFDGLTTSATLYGMRQNDSDRSNVAVFNTGSDPVTLKITAFSGDDGTSATVDAAKTLPAGGWAQYSGILGSVGIPQGWVTIERTSASGSFSAYGVINDNETNDGSYVLPTAFSPNPFLLPVITLPVIVETAAFQSEMVVANRSANVVTFFLSYTESLTPADGSVKGTVPFTLGPNEQVIIPGAVDFFRQLGVPLGAQGAGAYVGTVRALVLGTSLDNVFIGARTATPSPAGGQFGLFTPGVYAGQEASGSAFLYGLRSDADNRSNMAILNAGQDLDGPVTFSVQAFNSDAGGAPAGSAETKTLNPGQWFQYNNFLQGKGVSNGWVKVTRTAGTAAWITYGVINDGGQPGERTGDGAYIPMSR